MAVPAAEEVLDGAAEAQHEQEVERSPTDEQGEQAPPSDEERLEKVRLDIQTRTAAILAQGPAYLASRSLADFNAEAAKQQKAGEHAAAVATYLALFAKAQHSNLTHPEMYVCHSNCAAAYLKLGLFQEALRHANKCQTLAETSLRRNFKAAPSYVKSFLRKGQAQLGMGLSRVAAATFDAGLKLDPFNIELKLALQKANEAVLRDLAEGKARQTMAIEYPEAHKRISYHPYAAPLHKVKTDDMLPIKLLTPFQAENDHHIKDTHNYVTVQTDIRMPKRHLRQLEDAYFNAAWQTAIEAAVQAIAAEDKDVRVLNLASGAGLHAMMALRAGAFHVTAVERWLYLALACKESLIANQFTDEQARVLYKRPTDLRLKEDVPICCNLLVAPILDEGLLTSGLIPSVRHALDGLLTSDAILLPASATVYMQAVELRTEEVCGLKMSAANLYRWHPAYAAGVPLASERIIPLSKPKEVWYFDLGAPPERSDAKTVDVEFTRSGRWNAVMFWYKLHLFGDVYLSTGPEAVAEGLRCLQPAVQYIAGELAVHDGDVVPLVASHNTVRMKFDVESTEFLNLMRPDVSFPHHHFAMLADEGRCQAYQRAIERAIRAKQRQDGEAHVLDLGCGTGILSLLAARAGATSVVACEMQESLCDVARKAAAANGLSDKISIVQRDGGLLQRGHEVRALGVNVVVADVFDAGLLGDGFPYLLDLARRRVVQPGATVIPAAATVYCMGIEVLTGEVSGFNLAAINTYRWDATYEAVSLADVPHRRLTRPVKVLEQFFEGDRKARGRESMLKLEVIEEGVLNAVAFWFDLHLDDCETLTNAPDGIGEGGVLLCEVDSSAFGDSTSDGTCAADQPAADQPPEAGAAAEAEAGGQAEPAVEEKKPAATEPPPAPAAAADPAATAAAADGFTPAGSFEGAKPGFAFKLGKHGLGYYADAYQLACGGSNGGGSGSQAVRQASSYGSSGSSGSSSSKSGKSKTVRFSLDDTSSAAAHASSAAAPPTPAAAEAEPPAPELPPMPRAAPAAGPLPPGPRHHWGQALQYLDRAVPVAPGRKLALLARREEGRLRFALRQGVGEPVGRAPWKIEWGGGASIENPHFQRVHYCELLVRDFLQRVKCGRFPPIEKDMRMVLAHCGSLLLDPAALQEVCHELTVLEKLHKAPEFSPAATQEALTKRPLRLC